MIDSKNESLLAIIEQGIEQAKIFSESQLVSLTEKINTYDPVLFFEQAKKLSDDRTFWKSATDSFYIVSVGSVMTIQAHDNDRYEKTYEKWERFRQQALIVNPYDQEGTGILTIGGMSFDPKRKRTKLWENYPHSSFIIPKFTFTRANHNCFLTTTIIVSEKDCAKQLTHKLENEKLKLFANDGTFPQLIPISVKQEIDPEAWKEQVQKAITHIQANYAEKIVMARRMRIRLEKKAEITPILHQLLHLQQTSYIFAYERGDHCFIGATPERLVKVNGKKLLSTCLAGTSPRGKTNQEDQQKKEALWNDTKNRLEHDHVVQMIQESIYDYCTYLHIPDEPTVITLKNLHHLYTPVEGELRDKYSVFDIIRKLHPTPALGGSPTDRALDFIRKHETFDRGWYGSPIGWLDDRHNGEFAVGIRSGLIHADEVTLFAGCGVMGDSDIELEYEETKVKFLPMLTALEENHDTY